MAKPFMDDDECERLYQEGFTDGFDYWELVGVAQYLIWSLGYKKLRATKHLREYCQKYDPQYNSVLSRKVIHNAIDFALKKMPDEYVDVTITKDEIIRIREVRDYKIEKFLFGILVYAKRSKFDETYVRKKRNQMGYFVRLQDIQKVATSLRMRLSKKSLPIFLHNLYNLGYISPTKVGKIAILYSRDDSTPIISVRGSECPTEAYVRLHGGEFLYCDDCGRFVERKSNRQKKCSECYDEHRKAKVRVNMKNMRNKTND